VCLAQRHLLGPGVATLRQNVPLFARLMLAKLALAANCSAAAGHRHSACSLGGAKAKVSRRLGEWRLP
jgi:hypothetical protein